MDISRRETLVRKVVEYEGTPSSYFDEIRSFGWDCETELVILLAENIRNVLNKYSTGEITGDDVIEWANFIEQRDDIGLDEKQNKVLNEIIFWLANPEINYEINETLMQRINEMLNNNAI